MAAERRLADRHLALRQCALSRTRSGPGTEYSTASPPKFGQNLRNRLAGCRRSASRGSKCCRDRDGIRARARGRAEARGVGLEARRRHLDLLRSGRRALLHQLAERAGAQRLAAAAVPQRRRPPHRHVVRRELPRPAVPVQDRLRPGVRDVLAVQAPDLLRDPATRTRRACRKSTFSATPSRGSSNGPTRRGRTTGCSSLPTRVRARLVHSAEVPGRAGGEAMAASGDAGNPMFVPTYQGLSAGDFVRRAARRELLSVQRAASLRVLSRAQRDLSPVRARSARSRPRLTVLAPDYNSGNEILAHARRRRDDPLLPGRPRHARSTRRTSSGCAERHNPDVLYVIHYLGWPQPMRRLRAICRRRGMLLVEDCALSLLSEPDGQPLGSFGDWSVFCLYKTLPVPNGALLVQNADALEALERLRLRRAGIGVGRRTHGRAARAAHSRPRQRRRRGAAAGEARRRPRRRRAGGQPRERRRHRLQPRRRRSGDVGRVRAAADATRLRRDSPAARRELPRARRPSSTATSRPLLRGLPTACARCSFRCSCADKHAAARALRPARRGRARVLERRRDRRGRGESAADARFLRRHVLELPIHQDLTPRHIDHIGRAGA